MDANELQKYPCSKKIKTVNKGLILKFCGNFGYLLQPDPPEINALERVVRKTYNTVNSANPETCDPEFKRLRTVKFDVRKRQEKLTFLDNVLDDDQEELDTDPLVPTSPPTSNPTTIPPTRRPTPSLTIQPTPLPTPLPTFQPMPRLVPPPPPNDDDALLSAMMEYLFSLSELTFNNQVDRNLLPLYTILSSPEKWPFLGEQKIESQDRITATVAINTVLHSWEEIQEGFEDTIAPALSNFINNKNYEAMFVRGRVLNSRRTQQEPFFVLLSRYKLGRNLPDILTGVPLIDNNPTRRRRTTANF